MLELLTSHCDLSRAR